MIISASRRTDIPNYYAEWFYHRMKEGFVLVRNPMNIHHVSRIGLSADVVDCIVFWTKNPQPMIDGLDKLQKYPYYFQFTVNAYTTDVEPHVPPKDTVVSTFQRLSDEIGADRVIWRYDPIFLSGKYTTQYHIKYFETLAKRLSGYTDKCTISFIDFYRNTANSIKKLQIKEMTEDHKYRIAESFSQIAKVYGLALDTCAEDIDLSPYDIGHASCIDVQRIQKITGYRLDIGKDRNQRRECRCAQSIDIGMYHTCPNACRYCYANHSLKTVARKAAMHDSHAPLLCGGMSADDVVVDREVKSNKIGQLRFFD
jgi:DNA repair photolyase